MSRDAGVLTREKSGGRAATGREWPCDFQIFCRIEHANFVVDSRCGTRRAPGAPQRDDRTRWYSSRGGS